MAAWIASAIAGVLLLSGCAQKGEAPQAESAPPPAVPPTPQQLLGASVTGVFDAAVTLAEGSYAGPPAAGGSSRPTLQLWVPSIVFGDVVDSSAGNEAVALLSSNSGGSGEFVHLGVFAATDGQARSLAVAPVGDRVKLHRMWVEGGKVVMDVIEAGPGDAACCPTRVARKTYGWQDGKLAQLSSAAVGMLSVNLLASIDWVLVAMDGQPLPEGVMPPTVLVQYDKLVGFSGCNRYTGALSESAPGAIKVGALGATRKACEGAAADVEAKFLDHLSRADRYSLQAGQLLITSPAPGGAAPLSLLFAR
jgi:heat shock protein HslJ